MCRLVLFVYLSVLFFCYYCHRDCRYRCRHRKRWGFGRYHCRYQRYPTRTCRPICPLYRTSLRRTSVLRISICWSHLAHLVRQRRGRVSSAVHRTGALISACTITIALTTISTITTQTMDSPNIFSSSSSSNKLKRGPPSGDIVSRRTRHLVHNNAIYLWVLERYLQTRLQSMF